MKRALRILVRTTTLPIVVPCFVGVYIISLCFVFHEWLFETHDRILTFKQFHDEDIKGSAKKFILNFFR